MGALNRSRRSPFTRKYNLEYFLFLLPLFTFYFVFFLLPLLQSFYYSLTAWNGISAPRYVGLRNFRNILTRDPNFGTSILFTLKFTLLYAVAVNVVALFLGRLLTRGILFEKKLRVLFFGPNVVSSAITGIIWFFIFGPLFTQFSVRFGIPPIGFPTNPTVALVCAVIAQTWGALGWFALIYVAGYEAIPSEYYEAARIDGCGSSREFFAITLPLILPSVTVCLFLAITGGVQVWGLLYTMLPNMPATSPVIGNIYDTAFNSFLNGYGIAKSMILILITGVAGGLQVYLTRRKEVAL